MEKKLSPGATTCHVVARAVARRPARERYVFGPAIPSGDEPAPHPGIAGAPRAVAAREAAVDRARAESVPPKPELEHCHVPANGADTELTLTEQRTAARPESTPRPAADEPRRANPVASLETRAARSSSAGPAPRRSDRVEPVGPEPDLEGGDASTGCEPARERTRERQWTPRRRRRRSDACGSGSPIGLPFLPRRRCRSARLQSRGCLPR